MTILCDIDNTILNTSEVLLQWCNERYGTSYVYNDITSYDWFNETFGNDVWSITDSKEFWLDTKVNPDAIKVLYTMLRKQNDVYFVTASHFNDALGFKIRHIQAQMPAELRHDNKYIVASDKYMLWDGGTIIIDDYPYNLYGFDKRILFEQPWNYLCSFGRKAQNWHEVYNILNEMTK